MTPRFLPALFIAFAATVATGGLRAQNAGVPVEPATREGADARVVAEAEKLRLAGSLLSKKDVAGLLAKPTGDRTPVATPAPRDRPLSGRELAAIARRAYVRIGWYYLCPRCDRWHLNLAGGYAISADGAVATCYHCVKPGDGMREGYLVAVDASGAVRAVTGIVAANEPLDAAVVRVAKPDATPLALQDAISPGDRAYLFSEPFGLRGYFSEGVVNRFYWKKGDSGDPTVFADATRLRLNAGTDWAPGSSGAALLDACGNAIGHVSTINTLAGGGKADGKTRPPPPLITLHEAVPARGVILMLREAAKK